MSSFDKKIGIIGGGQLGRMTIQEARKMDIYVDILTPSHPSPASEISNDFLVGSLYDEEKIKELASRSDILTYEIEHININVLKELEKQGKTIYPSAKVIEIIQDKSKQKKMLEKNGIPTSKWKMVSENNIKEIISEFGYPVVQKSCRGGYDGKGVMILKDERDLKDIIKSESFLENFVNHEMEIAVMVARNKSGEIKTYPVVEMVFDEKTNICDTVVSPARIKDDLAKKAQNLAVKCVKALDGVGIFGVEMFLTKHGEILINEIAPRPHNSGHYTIEGCKTSQYEQYLRAIMDLPLGSTELLSPACMVNVLGEPGYNGDVLVKGGRKALKIDGASIHIYGKKQTRPHRKMGHITVLADTCKKAYENARKAQNFLKIITK
ncbi:MAG: 5-(carboxyamino)imidazole ribonucleotide synthase [Fusobacteriota bacterium]